MLLKEPRRIACCVMMPNQRSTWLIQVGVRRRVMHLIPRPFRQPCLHRSVLVRGVVVHDQMHVQMRRDVGIDVAQKRQELLMAMARLAAAEYPAGDHVQCREQGRGAVPEVVMGDPFDIAQAHGQHRLRALERLDLALLVDAQHHRMLRWIEVQPGDVAYLLDEERVVGQLEVLLPVRLHAEHREPALHRALGDAGVLGHGTHAPLGAGGRFGMQRRIDEFGHALIVIGPWASRPQFIVQIFKAVCTVPCAPLADGGVADPHAGRDRAVGRALDTGEDNLGTLDQSVWQ